MTGRIMENQILSMLFWMIKMECDAVTARHLVLQLIVLSGAA